jgi:hypothetical protein
MLTIVCFHFCLFLWMSFKRVGPSIMLYYGPLVGYGVMLNQFTFGPTF